MKTQIKTILFLLCASVLFNGCVSTPTHTVSTQETQELCRVVILAEFDKWLDDYPCDVYGKNKTDIKPDEAFNKLKLAGLSHDEIIFLLKTKIDEHEKTIPKSKFD